MLTNYYDINYANGDCERVYRFEDMVACKLGSKEIKSLKEYKLTKEGWKVRTIVWVNVHIEEKPQCSVIDNGEDTDLKIGKAELKDE